MVADSVHPEGGSDAAESRRRTERAAAARGDDRRRRSGASRRRTGDREALVARHQGIRLSYAELDAASDRLACALLALGVEQGDRIGIWAPNCAEWVLTQFATARIGAVLVNINPAYRTTELRYALAQSGCRALIAAARVQVVGLRRDGRGGPARSCPRSSGRVLARRRRSGTSCSRAPARSRRARWSAREAALYPGRPDQHPVHERHDRRPEGRDAHAPQHPQQRLPRRRRVRLQAGGPRLHPGAVLPLLRHGHGQPRRRRPRRVHGHPAARRSSPRRRWRRSPRSAARRSTACRRCSSPSSSTRRSPTSTCPRCGPGSWPARRARSR